MDVRLLGLWLLDEGVYIAAAGTADREAKKVFEAVVVVGVIDNGDAIYLVVDVVEKTFVAVGTNGFCYVIHLLVVDGFLWRSILIRCACFYFDEMKFVVFHGNDVEFATSVQIPVLVEDLIAVAREEEGCKFFPCLSHLFGLLVLLYSL